MSFLKDLREYEPKHYMLVVLTALVAVGPGFLAVYRYRQDLFVQLDVIKLLVWSAALSMPVVALNVPVVTQAGEIEGEDYPLGAAWSIAAAVTAIVMYTALFVSYLGDWTFRTFAIACVGIELFTVAALVSNAKQARKKRTRFAPVELESIEQAHQADAP